MPEAELQRRMGIYFPDPSGKQCHMQTHMHRALQEVSHSTNIYQMRREVELILKKKLKIKTLVLFLRGGHNCSPEATA